MENSSKKRQFLLGTMQMQTFSRTSHLRAPYFFFFFALFLPHSKVEIVVFIVKKTYPCWHSVDRRRCWRDVRSDAVHSFETRCRGVPLGLAVLPAAARTGHAVHPGDTGLGAVRFHDGRRLFFFPFLPAKAPSSPLCLSYVPLQATLLLYSGGSGKKLFCIEVCVYCSEGGCGGRRGVLIMLKTMGEKTIFFFVCVRVQSPSLCRVLSRENCFSLFCSEKIE